MLKAILGSTFYKTVLWNLASTAVVQPSMHGFVVAS